MRDHPSTIPAPAPTETEFCPAEQDTGRYQDEAALARAYVAACSARDEFEKWVRYLAGKLNGVEVDIAQSQAFEQRVTVALDEIDRRHERNQETLSEILKVCRRNETHIGILIDSYREHRTRISTLESNPVLSLVPPAQEAE